MAVIACPICATRYRVADSQLSKVSRLKCKKCKTVFPLTENVRTESFTGETQTLSPSEDTGTSPQFVGAETQTFQRQPDTSSGLNLDDLSLDSEAPPESSSGFDFSFDTNIPDNERTGEEAKIHDHIADDSQENKGQIEVGLGALSLVDGESDLESTLSMEQGLDFSFSANIPETEPEEGEEGPLEESEEMPEASGPGSFQEGLDLGEISGVVGEQTLTLTDRPATGPLEEVYDDSQAPVFEEPLEDEGIPQEEAEPLSTCCIDSLAMGLKTCEICGRNLEGREHEVGAELEQQRRQQLKEELLRGEAQIGFSEEAPGDETAALQQAEEDFTDVEQALDALADGTFEKTIKKKEARKAAAKRIKMIGAVIVFALVIAAGVLWTFRPKPEETLMRRYRDIISQQEVDPREVALLFLDAASEKSQEVFKLVSIMEPIPDIAGGTIESVGEEHEETPLGSPGKEVARLHEEIEILKKEYEGKDKEWQEATEKKNLTLKLIATQVNTLTTKQETLQIEFDEKEAESAAKLVKLKQQLDAAEQELEENKRRADKYMDATDELGKATYKAAKRKVDQLTDTIIPGLKKQINQEEAAHQKRMDELNAEYDPRFAEIQTELETQQALYDEVKLLQDPKNSPLIALDLDLKELKKTIAEKENVIAEKEKQLETAKRFFTRKGQKEQIEKNQHIAEFTHVSRNIVASAKLDGSKQKVLLVLKRYQAMIGDQTIQGDWVVETILR